MAISRIIRVGFLGALIALSACSDGQTTGETEPAPTTVTSAPSSTAAPADESLTMQGLLASMPALPEREGPRRETTGSVPHQQLEPPSVPGVDAELRRRLFALPGVERQASSRSLPGAEGLVLVEGFEAGRPTDAASLEEVLGNSREFAHFHPDGSLHVWLPVERATEVHDTKWGEMHPWVDRDGFWAGVVMVYVPESLDEAEVATQIIVDAYNFVSGQNLTPDDIP